MSANNQILIKEHKGKYYVFDNVMAESWCDENMEHENELNIKSASASFDNKDDAILFAYKLDNERDEDNWYIGGTEYGVVEEVLYKDGGEIKIIE